MGVSVDDLIIHQEIIDQQDEQIIGYDPQGGAHIERERFGPTHHPVMFFHVGDEGLADEEATHDEEDINAMWQWDLRYEIECGILYIMLSMTMYHTKDGESSQ